MGESTCQVQNAVKDPTRRFAVLCYTGRTMRRSPLPRHKRVATAPRMRLTERDVLLLSLIWQYRVLRRDQIQQLLFPSKNTANERLKQLYQHGFLQRRWLPVEYGQGMSQALYLLAARGADLLAQRLGFDRGAIHWRASHNKVSSPFLEHMLMINDVRINSTLAAKTAGYRIERWLTQEELSASPDHVHLSGVNGSRRVAVIPDSYFCLRIERRRAHFFIEADRATVSNRRWSQRVFAYLEYVRSGQYTRRYGARCLRVLTVTTGAKRLANLKRTTERAEGGPMFWFATLGEVTADAVLRQCIWHVASQEGIHPLLD